jgi:hypothetical protein
MNFRIVLAYLAACGSPALALSVAGVFFSHHSAGSSIALFPVFSLVGALVALPVAVPLIAWAVCTGYLRFWTCVAGGSICGALILLIAQLQQQNFHHINIPYSPMIGPLAGVAALVVGGAFGAIPGFVFGLVLRATGYFTRQALHRDPAETMY